MYADNRNIQVYYIIHIFQIQSLIWRLYKKFLRETKKRQIALNGYLEYFPVDITLDDNWRGKTKCDIEALDAAYTEFFKIPVPQSAKYVITVEKNEAGKIIRLAGGDDGQSIYSWNTVCAASDTDLYFTFDRYSMSGAKLDTSQIPGGYGVYRQPYSIVGDELIFDTEKLSMVYSLEEETYRNGSVFLDVTEAGELLVLIDQEETTRLQVVDLETMELLQMAELARPEECKGFEAVVRTKEDFFVLWYGGNYISVVAREEGKGFCQKLLIPLEPEDPLYFHMFLNENDMEWNGEQLVYACYSNSRCNLELAVYDKTGKVFHGRYYSSLLAEQEYAKRALGEKNNWYYECEPRTNISLDVEWP